MYIPGPAPPAPDTALPRRLSAREKADLDRSVRLLKTIAGADEGGTGWRGGLSEFERVFFGVGGLPGQESRRRLRLPVQVNTARADAEGRVPEGRVCEEPFLR